MTNDSLNNPQNNNSMKKPPRDSGDILTFKNIFGFIKRSSPRLLLYGMVALVLTTIILSIIYFINAERKPGYAVAQIEFNYPGVEKGLDPAEQILDLSYLKSPANISKALQALNSDADANIIRNNLMITAVVPEYIAEQYNQINRLIEADPANWSLLSQLNYYPNRFMIELTDSDLGETACKEILNELLKQYRTYFISKYYSLTTFNFNMLNPDELNKYDYFTILNIFESHLTLFESYLKEFLAGSAEHRSSSTTQKINEATTHSQLIREFYLKPAKTDVSSYYITKYTYGDYKRAFNMELIEAVAQANILEDSTSALRAIVDNFDKDKIVIIPDATEMVEVVKPSELYDELVQELIVMETQLAIAKQKASEMQALKSEIDALSESQTSSVADKARVETLISNLNTNYNSMVDNVSSAVMDYLDNEYMKDAVKIVSPAAFASARLSLYNYIIALIIVFAAAEFTAFIETAVRIYSEKQKTQEQE